MKNHTNATATLIALMAIMSSALLFQCGKVVDTQPTDAGGSNTGTGSSSGDNVVNDGGGVGSADGATDTGSSTTTTVDAATPDLVCEKDDASACESLPPSRCVDNTTLLYFSDGACVDGKCTWKRTLKPCGIQSYCVQDGCTPPTTK